MPGPFTVTIGGGKGGIGKSTIVANVGYMLSEKGFGVGFIDADLGGANLHLMLGVKRPERGLQDFMSGRVPTLREAAVDLTMPNSWLISGAADVLEQANPGYAQKRRIISHIAKLQSDYILVDLGAGASSNTTDFFAAFPFAMVVLDNMPTSIENAYGFIKNGIIRGLLQLFPGNRELRTLILRAGMPAGPESFATIDEMLLASRQVFAREYRIMRQWLSSKRVFLVLSMVRERADVAVAQRFQAMIRKYLTVNAQYIGYVAYLSEVRASIRRMKPVVSMQEPAQARQCFEAITRNLVALTQGT